MKGRLTNAQVRERKRQVKSYNVKMAAQTVREDKRAERDRQERFETLLRERQGETAQRSRRPSGGLDARRNEHAV